MTRAALARLTDAELNEAINANLIVVCEGFASVNEAADAFRVSPDPLDRRVAEQLDRCIGYAARERETGRMQ